MTGLLLQKAGLAGLEALRRGMFAGPVLHGSRGFAEFVGHGRERTGLTQLEMRHEGAEGARGFAGKTREGGRGSRRDET